MAGIWKLYIEKQEYCFIADAAARRWFMDGFLIQSEKFCDISKCGGIELILEPETEDRILNIRAITYVNRDQLNDEYQFFPEASVLVEKGAERLTVSLDEFQYNKAQAMQWYFTEAFSFMGAKVKDVRILEGNPLHITCGRYSRYVEYGETAEYSLRIKNCSAKRVLLDIREEKNGWEACEVSFSEKHIVLEAGSCREVSIFVRTSMKMISGSREYNKIIVKVNDIDYKKEYPLTFITGIKVGNPYLIHNEEGWNETREKIRNYSWAQEDFKRYLKAAEEFEPYEVKSYIPEAADQNSKNGFIETFESEKCMNTAVAYKVTGEKQYALKCAKLFQILISKYLDRNQAGTNALVQEGHFFQHMAMAYDLIKGKGFLTEMEEEKVEQCFYRYMHIVDRELYIGEISNHYLAEMVGAACCAMAVQDAERIERFVYGNCGILEHLSRSIFDDGWYYECTLGYNLWVLVLFMQVGIPLERFGYYILNEKVSANNFCELAPRSEFRYGTESAEWGAKEKNYRNIEMMLQGLMPFADYRGVVFAMNDAQDHGIYTRRHGFSPYDLAYYIYRKPEYAYFASLSPCRDCLYGVAELPDYDGSRFYKMNADSYNAGYTVLRSKGENDRERIQMVTKYGSHGGYHGHFDRLSLVSMMRYGKSFYFPEFVWYTYSSYMYKFYVQNSLNHNMVVVDGKNQEAVPCEKLLQYDGENMQVIGLQAKARWANPPFGGMEYGQGVDIYEKALKEGKSFPYLKDHPQYGEVTDYTETVTSTRTFVLTNDYLIINDHIKAQKEHVYDCIYHPAGLKSISNVKYKEHRNKFDESALSSGQFITDCDVYEPTDDLVQADFEMNLRSNGEDKFQTCIPDDGHLKMAIRYLHTECGEIITGRTPVNRNAYAVVSYELQQNGRKLEEGTTGAWILGAAKLCNIPVEEGFLKLRFQADYCNGCEESPLVLTDAAVTLFDGRTMPITADMCRLQDGIPSISAALVEGEHHRNGIWLTPEKRNEGELLIKLPEGSRTFSGIIGMNYLPYVNSFERKMICLRKTGEEAEFISILELFEEESVIKKASYLNNELIVEKTDGSTETICFKKAVQEITFEKSKGKSKIIESTGRQC
ncbi:heparinase II/III domain-containing protein [Eisenbergiella sp.]|uniref:heparinase II/III domain-containing protein n=1 Tax=Eisenbergiella sp. TaxID=1924109 RepID=UPI002A81975D|nr:heparinase II/III family protein [Eisenbergiella sp.]